MTIGVTALRAVLVTILGLCLWTAGQARAATGDYLMVPSAAMGRDIPVAFMDGGGAGFEALQQRRRPVAGGN